MEKLESNIETKGGGIESEVEAGVEYCMREGSVTKFQ